MKLRSALLAATVLAAPVAAKAEAVNGLYIGLGAGANIMHNESIDSIGVAAGLAQLRQAESSTNSRPQLHLDTGFVVLGSAGYGFGNGLRVEGEYSYRQNKYTNFNFRGVSGFRSAGGDEEKHTGMVNVLYDFDPNVLGLGFFPFPITPYAGLGVGASWVQAQNSRFNAFAGPLAPDGTNFGRGFPNGFRALYRSNDGDVSIATQFIAGAAFPIPAVPGLSLTTEYRFLAVPDERTYNYQFFAPGVATRARIRESDNFNHSVLVGLRYAFNAAPPPPPPQPPQPFVERGVARTFLVFFDWDRADLTARARQVVAEAARAAQSTQTRIMVNGHTDLSGTARYNQGLSVRRANAVAAELVRNGVPRGAIVTRGFGESRPLVPTANGVREPQNRRVEIVLQ